MSRTSLGILAGTALAGGLLVAVSGSVLAKAPPTQPTATPSGAYRSVGAGMMASGGGMMGQIGAMDGADVQQMVDWMDQAGPQVKAMHDAMETSGCSEDAMKQFLASPRPTRE